MVEVLRGRAREPTGPTRRAPRTYPGPVELQVRRVGPREDVEVASGVNRPQLEADSKNRGTESRVPFRTLVCVLVTQRPKRSQGRPKLVARVARSAKKSEELPSEGVDPTGQDKTEKDVSPSRERQLAARFEDKSEPKSGSHVRSEAGERNVAERRHGHPCGQQPMDEADGHCPQGTEASRLGVHRRRCHFRGAGFSDHRQQRSNAQSVSFYLILKNFLGILVIYAHAVPILLYSIYYYK
ncbi:dna repair protein [Lasius niger]|uniref:Dna repair protein n=1 Tax=Lasius niger TaxID=67767 RepID=A0A0J7L700_LASNI|nr:dna repair protein [Lasius niger]